MLGWGAEPNPKGVQPSPRVGSSPSPHVGHSQVTAQPCALTALPPRLADVAHNNTTQRAPSRSITYVFRYASFSRFYSSKWLLAAQGRDKFTTC